MSFLKINETCYIPNCHAIAIFYSFQHFKVKQTLIPRNPLVSLTVVLMYACFMHTIYSQISYLTETNVSIYISVFQPLSLTMNISFYHHKCQVYFSRLTVII